VIERELHAHERAALIEWADREVPTDFADEVLARWEAERDAPPLDDEYEGVAVEPIQARVVATQIEDRRNVKLAWWCGMVAAAAAILLALGLAWPRSHEHGHSAVDPTSLAEPTPELVALRIEARAQLLANCTPCHLGRNEAAKPAALAIFDLDDARWHDRLSADQLVGASERMGDRAAPEETAGFRRYVAAELAHRRTSR
jgi:hypothetical protein